MSFYEKLLTPELKLKVDELHALVMYYVDNAPYPETPIPVDLSIQKSIYFSSSRMTEFRVPDNVKQIQNYVYERMVNAQLQPWRNRWDVIERALLDRLSNDGITKTTTRIPSHCFIVRNPAIPSNDDERKARAFRSMDQKIAEILNMAIERDSDWKHVEMDVRLFYDQCVYSLEWIEEWRNLKAQEDVEIRFTFNDLVINIRN